MGDRIKNIQMVFPEDGFIASPALKKNKKAFDLLKETFSGKTINVDVTNVKDSEIEEKLKELQVNYEDDVEDNERDSLDDIHKSLKFCIDYDGTCVTEEFPKVGDEVPHVVVVLKELVEKGHRLILWTARSGKLLQDAIDWFESRNIPLYGVNKDPHPLEGWPVPRKVIPAWYIDDRNLGTPIMKYKYWNFEKKQLLEFEVVDWFSIEKILKEKGIL